jgi:hypothetical protein
VGGKRRCCLPPGALDELITRVETLEREKAADHERIAVLEGAINALVVVYGVRRLPTPDQPGDGDRQ